MMTGMSTMSVEQRQLHRWVMDLANYLSEEKGVSRSAALHKAHLTKALLQALGEGKVTFTYRKKDGTLRTAHGTLRHGICREFDEYSYANEKSDDEAVEWPYDVFVYWDLDRQGFRSFRAEDLEAISKNNQPL